MEDLSTHKIIVLKTQTIELRKNDAGLWVDALGTIWAVREGNQADNVDRCGVWPLVMPIETPLEEGCKVHDYFYSSPAYQKFHSRAYADSYMKMLNDLATKDSFWGILSAPFYHLARTFGDRGWENKETR